MTTNPEQYFRIKSIFERAIDIPSGSGRDAFLDEVCNDIDHIRSEVESLLREHETDHDFMETPAMGAGFAVNVDELHDDYSEEDAFNWLPEDRTIGGKYHIQSLLAFGGMGAVYEATQENPSRTVALKVMRRGFAGRSVRRRFEYECEALAKLQHPHIAHLYDCGIHYLESVRKGGDGISYFVMEYIDNAKSFTEWVKLHSLGTRERLRLFLDVCEAIHHGHQRGIIHRDIKPGNILVGSDGEVKVIDFGVACITDSDIAITTMHTDIGQLIGTVQYMSPEQCAGDADDIDVRSDVYALGLILYELLTDELPYDVAGQSVVQAVRTVQESQPRRLSTIHSNLRGDLETIVFKALAKEREARYQSVDEMSRDVAHYLHHEPIVARPASMIYRTAKFVERYRWQSATTVAILLMIVISIAAVFTGQLAWRANRNEALAFSIAQGAKQNSALAAILASEPAEAKQILNRIPEELRRWEWYHINSTIDQSMGTIAPPKNFPNSRWLDMDISDDGRIMVTVTQTEVVIWDLRTHKQIDSIQQTSGRESFMNAALSPDHQYLAIAVSTILPQKEETTAPAESAASVRLMRLKDKAILADAGLGMGVSNDIQFLQRKADELIVAVAFIDVGINADIHAHEVTLLKYQGENAAGPPIESGPRLVEIAQLNGHTWDIRSLALSRSGKYLASTSTDHTARIWDVAEPADARCVAVLRGNNAYIMGASFSSHDAVLATASLDNSIKLWDIQKSIAEYTQNGDDGAIGVQMGTLLGHNGGVTDVAFSPRVNEDGSLLLASGSIDNTIRLWKVEPHGHVYQLSLLQPDDDGELRPKSIPHPWKVFSYRQMATLHGQSNWITKVDFLPDGSQIVSMSQDGTVKFWLPSPVETVPTLLGHTSSVFGVVFTPDSRYLISASADQTARIWDVDRAVEVCKIPTTDVRSAATVRNDSGILAAVGSGNGTIFMWDITDPAKPIALPSLKGHHNTVNSVTFSRDGTRLLSAGRNGTARLWNTSQPIAEPVILEHPMSVSSAVFSPDERWIITGTGPGPRGQNLEGGTITVWDAVTHERVASFTEHEAGITSLSIKRSGDTTWLISTSQDKTAIIWDGSDLPNLRALHRLAGHTGAVLSSAIHPTENRIATGSADCTIKIWDLDTGAEMATLRGHIAQVTDLAFSPDGKRLASTSAGHEGNDNSIKLWETKWDPALAELRWQAKQEARRKKAEATQNKSQ